LHQQVVNHVRSLYFCYNRKGLRSSNNCCLHYCSMVEGQQRSSDGIASTATQESKKKLLETRTKTGKRQTSTSKVHLVAVLLVMIFVLVIAIVIPLVVKKKRQSSAGSSSNNNNNAAIVATPSTEFMYVDGVGFLFLHGSTTSVKTVMVFQSLCPDGEADDSWHGCSGCGLSACPNSAVCVCGQSWDFIPASQGSTTEGLDVFQIMDECMMFQEFFEDDSRYGVFFCGTHYGAVTAAPINTTMTLDWEENGDSDNSHLQEVAEFLRDSEEFQKMRNNQ
jgi:hypothetical protein